MYPLSGLLVQATIKCDKRQGEMNSEELLVYLGTYTGGESRGIYRCRMNSVSGRLGTPEVAAEMENPTFLALHPSSRYLYAVNEVESDGERLGGTVSAFARDLATGSLTPLNRRPSGGSGPCHLNVDKTGRCLVVANYVSGSVSALRIEEDGRLGATSAFFQHEGSSIDPNRQRGPHAHSVNFSPDNRYVFVCDLGLDRVFVYRFDSRNGSMAAAEPPSVAVAPGAGPRHFTFHPSGRFAYVINELDSTVTVFRYDVEEGSLNEERTVSTLPDCFDGESTTAEVLVSSDGRFLYGSNRGHDSIVIFALDEVTGRPLLVEHQETLGETPRNFAFEPSGKWLLAANQNTHSVVIFRVVQATGRLIPAGQVLEIPEPVCVRFARIDTGG